MINIDNENNIDLNLSLLESASTLIKELTEDSRSVVSTISTSDSHRSYFSSSEIQTHSSLSVPLQSSCWDQLSNVESKSKKSTQSPSTRSRRSNKMMKLEDIKNNKETSSFIDQTNRKKIEEMNDTLANLFLYNIPFSIIL